MVSAAVVYLYMALLLRKTESLTWKHAPWPSETTTMSLICVTATMTVLLLVAAVYSLPGNMAMRSATKDGKAASRGSPLWLADARERQRLRKIRERNG